MNTESRRRASANYHAKRERYGIKRATWWSTTETRDALDVLAERFGTKDAAINAAILALLETIKGGG